MRTPRIAIVLSLAIFAAGLAVFLTARQSPPSANQIPGIDFTQPEHPVTPEMIREADKLALKDAPEFHLTSVRDEVATISGKQQRPQFVLFILDGCPCSIDAQPLFNNLAKQWKGQVDFYGVIDSDQKKGRAWASDYRAAFPVVPDAKKEIIKAYGAKQSVYCVLISTDGKVVKMWPGYSQDMMKEMNEMIAAEAGAEAKPFDAQYAPNDKTSGCFF